MASGPKLWERQSWIWALEWWNWSWTVAGLSDSPVSAALGVSASYFPSINLLLLQGGKHGHWWYPDSTSEHSDLFSLSSKSEIPRVGFWLASLSHVLVNHLLDSLTGRSPWSGKEEGRSLGKYSRCLLQTWGWMLRTDSSFLVSDPLYFPSSIFFLCCLSQSILVSTSVMSDIVNFGSI